MTHIVVMGVSGAGKTTLAHALAQHLGWPFLEGDDLHPPANVAKMAAGIPLDDADRAPWLAAIRAHIDAERSAGGSGIVSCSALKREYRAQLGGGATDVHFVHLAAERAVLAAHLAGRANHFMPPSLLDSQIATLRAPTAAEAVIIDAALPTRAQVALVITALGIV